MKKLFTLFQCVTCLGCLLLIVQACRKNDTTEHLNREAYSLKIPYLAKYNIYVSGENSIQTKGAHQGNLTLEWDKVIEKRFPDGNVFQQIPLSVNGGREEYGSVGYAWDDMYRNVHSLQWYLLIRKAPLEQDCQTLLAMVIPEKKPFKEYNLFQMKNFRGVILYYTLAGESVGANIFDQTGVSNGQVLLPQEIEDTSIPLIYINKYVAQNKTKSEDGLYGGVLDECIVIGKRPDTALNIDMLEQFHKREEGGGGAPEGTSDQLPDQPEPQDSVKKISGFSEWNFDTKSLEMFKGYIEELMKDCAAKSVLNAISKMEISFKYIENYRYPVAFVRSTHSTTTGTFIKYTYAIKWDAHALTTPTVFEELVHGLQVLNGNYDKKWALNVEIEAKIAAYQYALKHGILDGLGGSDPNKFKTIFGGYLADPPTKTYENLIQFMRGMQGYELMTEDSNHRNMNNILNLFNCYEKKEITPGDPVLTRSD